jgi:hypothetical protein
MLSVGFSDVDITPPIGLKMAGMPRPPRAEGVRWPLRGRTVVFDGGSQAVAVVSLDLLVLHTATVPELRAALAAGTGLDPAAIMIACSHTHRGPFTTALMDEEADFAYLDLLRERLVAGMAHAWAARQPAHLRVARASMLGCTFNRRPIFRGDQVGTQGPAWIEECLGLEGPADPDLHVLAVEDAGGAVLGGLVAFACHTTLMGGLPFYSADYPGPLTDELARRLGGTWAFLQGAGGNLWATDLTQRTPRFTSGEAAALALAGELAQGACAALAGGRLVDSPHVAVERDVLTIAQRRPSWEQVELARWYLEQAGPDVDQRDFTRRIYGHDYTFYANSAVIQEWFARQTIAMWEWQRHTGAREPAEQLEVQAIALGDVALAGYPVELFTEFGLATKERSPFAETVVVSLANGWHGYVPTQEAFAHGGYEPRLGYQSRLVPEAGERLLEAAVGLLAGLRSPAE